jgi:DNA-binding NtrC family response regulator
VKKEKPVVIVSAFGDRENLLEALRLGASDFLEKPFTEDMVLTIAKRVLEIGASKRALGRLASEEGEGVSNVSRIFDMHKERRKIAVLSKKLNMESRRKKRAR